MPTAIPLRNFEQIKMSNDLTVPKSRMAERKGSIWHFNPVLMTD